MPQEPDKRQLRQLKRTIKRAGSKHRRRELKRQLEENPDEAPYAEENLGRHRSDTLNGLDRPTTQEGTSRRDEGPQEGMRDEG